MRRFLPFALVATFTVAVPAVASAQGGDLTPPGTVDPNAPGSPTPAPPQPPNGQAEELKKSEKEDSEIGLKWVWLNAEAGFSRINMTSFDNSTFALKKDESNGFVWSVGAALQLLGMTFGLRARNHAHDAYSLWQVNLELGLHLRFGRVDPYFLFRGGYDFMGKLDGESVSNPTTAPASASVTGWNGGGAFGLDFYLTKVLTLGAQVNADILFLKRPPAELPKEFALLPPAQQLAIKNDPLYQQSGTSVGYGLGIGALLGLHF